MRKRWFIAGAAVLGTVMCTLATPAEEKDKGAIHLKEIVVTATRYKTIVLDSPYAVRVYDSEQNYERMPDRIPSLLEDAPEILVQKTSSGRETLSIRGFIDGYRVLTLIDGVRLNNSTYRSGPNQYMGTIDALSVDRMEIVKGPSSVLYGSDAIGGTVQVFTIEPDPEVFKSGGFKQVLYGRYESASNSSIARYEVHAGMKGRLAAVAGFSWKDFNDIVGGRYVGLMPKTGFEERDGDLKVKFALTSDSMLTFAFQKVDQNDVWRAHKTIYGIEWEGLTHGSNLRRSLDQDRQLTYIQYVLERRSVICDRLTANLSYHVQEEDRIDIKSDGRFSWRGVDVGTTGLWVQAEKESRFGYWTYGVEWYHDEVDSYRRDYNADGSLRRERIQGPVADDATYDLGALYVQNLYKVTKQLDLITGLRLNTASVDADKVEDPQTGDQISISDDWTKLVGSLRAVYEPEKRWRIFGGISQGFRAPNLSDLTRFDSARTDEIEVPSPGLDPENFVAFEAGARYATDKVEGELTLFYTDISDMIIRYPTGNVIDGDYEVIKENVGDGHVQGAEMTVGYVPAEEWLISLSAVIMDGEATTYPTVGSTVKESKPLSRLVPPTAVLKVRRSFGEKGHVEMLVRAADRQDDLSPRDERDTSRIPPGGTPGYAVIHLGGAAHVTKDLSIYCRVENVTNKDYRIHGSGENEPGTNFVLGVKWTL